VSEYPLSQESPTVSIVTPSFNQAKYLEATLQSVIDQTYTNIEYIVVDGGSEDGSLSILDRYQAHLAALISEPDLGQADAINKGFGLATGDVLAWLNSDDTYEPRAVESAVRYLTQNPETGMVYGNAHYIDEDGNRIARYPAAQTDYRGLRRGVNTIPQQAMFFRSKLWRMVGPLDPSFFYAMDYDLWVRIAAVTPIAFLPDYWANFRLHDESKSLTAARRCWPEMMRVHFRDGGSIFSILYAKYLLRRVLEPVMPWRLRYRQWTYALEKRRSGES
jgi:glycosyltransferase involved in cell wall biosynthesis